jgi:ATP-dependent helicase HepA
LASKVEIYAHQLEVVARVLEDPVHRFILADEVGLGKTIEAGLILRQRFMDRQARRALVIVPDHLKGQWESELQGRFGLRAPAVEVESFSSVASAECLLADDGWTDLVVDEAHHAAAWVDRGDEEGRRAFESISQLAGSVEGLLLLSATPQETTPERLLVLLELLDPELHSRRHLQQFRRRLELRDVVLDVLRMIENEESAIFYVDELREIALGLDSGSALRAELERIASGADAGDEPSEDQLASLKTQFRETFRLHNRLIRSSRLSDRLVSWREPLREVGHDRHFAEMLRAPALVDQQQAFEEHVREWQLRAIQYGVNPALACTLISSGLFAACMGAEAVVAWCSLRRDQIGAGEAAALFGRDAVSASKQLSRASWEDAILEQLEARAGESEWFTEKARAARDAILDLARPGGEPGHVVVFTTAPGAAEALGGFLESEFESLRAGEFEVIVLGQDADESAVMDASSDLSDDPQEAIRVLCASTRVEEGAHRQGAHRVLHFDIPRNLSSLEQRIGRVDRIGQSRTLEQVLLLPSAASSAASFFVQEVLSAFCVMSESISGVQGAAEGCLALLDAVHMQEGQDMGAICVEVREILASERRARAREREFDAAVSTDWRVGVDVDGVIAHEAAVGEMRAKLDRPLQKFAGLSADGRGPVGSYCESRNSTVDLSQAEERELRPLLGNRVIPAPGTFDRRLAVRDPSFALRRAGDPLVSWVERLLSSSGAGSSYAVIRQVESRLWQGVAGPLQWGSYGACWVFSYLVEPGVSTAVASDGVRRRRFMPTREMVAIVREEVIGHPTEVFWADEGIEEVGLDQRPTSPPMAWFNLRQHPYKNSKVTPLRFALNDIALNAENRDLLDPFMSVHDWEERVHKRAERALAAVRFSNHLRSWTQDSVQKFEFASFEHERILQMRAPSEAKSEVAARDRVVSSMRNPAISLSSAGFVLVTGAGL